MNGIQALTEIAEYWDLPTVISYPFQDATIGGVFNFITERLPNATLIDKKGVTSVFDNQEFTDAVAELGVKKLLLAGISLDINVVPAALAAQNLGYEVYIVVDASGTFNKQMRDISLARFVQAGIIPITWFAIGGELMGDWLSMEGSGFYTIAIKYIPFFGNMMSTYSYTLTASQQNSTVEDLITQRNVTGGN